MEVWGNKNYRAARKPGRIRGQLNLYSAFFRPITNFPVIFGYFSHCITIAPLTPKFSASISKFCIFPSFIHLQTPLIPWWKLSRTWSDRLLLLLCLSLSIGISPRDPSHLHASTSAKRLFMILRWKTIWYLQFHVVCTDVFYVINKLLCFLYPVKSLSI